MTTTSLSVLLARLKQTGFPDFPDDEMFSSWVAEMAEMDGHIVGLARQAEAGQEIDRRQLRRQFAGLRTSFGRFAISELSSEDRKIHQTCVAYLALLEEVTNAITGASQRPPKVAPGN